MASDDSNTSSRTSADPEAPARSNRSREGEAGSGSGFRRIMRRAWSILTTVASVSLVAGVVGGAIVYRPLMKDEVSRRVRQKVEVQIEWPRLGRADGTGGAGATGGNRAAKEASGAGMAGREAPATWLDAGSQTSLLRLANDTLSEDPLDAESVRATQAALMQTGWFASACRVTRLPGNRVIIQGDWREPVAAVRSGERDYLVSAKGERLPPDYQPEASGLKVLIGPERPAPAVGDVWLGGDVQAGLALLGCLRDAPARQRQDILEQARAIDVSEYALTKNLYIVTDTGSRILWGGEPGTFVPGQAKDNIKLDRLARLVRDHGRIDASRDFLDISLAGVY